MIEINNLSQSRINQARVKKIASAFFRKYKLKEDRMISLAIIGDSKMKQLNSVYRGHNQTTDVLSFPALDEIIINIKQIKRQAKELGQRSEDEFDFILVHALLHLIGFQDESEADRLKMMELGKDFLLNLK